MAVKKQQQEKKKVQPAEQQSPASAPLITQISPVPEPDKAAPTTIKLKPETKGRLEILKGMLNIDDFDAVVCRLIDTLPAKLSTEEEIVLKMTVSKYRWLLAHQDSCDCRNALNDAKV